MPRKTPETLRSRRWFGPADLRSFGHRSRLKQAGLDPADLAVDPAPIPGAHVGVRLLEPRDRLGQRDAGILHTFEASLQVFLGRGLQGLQDQQFLQLQAQFLGLCMQRRGDLGQNLPGARGAQGAGRVDQQQRRRGTLQGLQHPQQAR